MASCTAKTTRGPCRAPAVVGSHPALCNAHSDPESWHQASVRGGKAPRRIHIDSGPNFERPKHLRGGNEIAAFLESAIGGTVSGKMSTTQLKAIAAASRVMLAALEAADVQEQIEDLRTAVKRIEETGFRVTR